METDAFFTDSHSFTHPSHEGIFLGHQLCFTIKKASKQMSGCFFDKYIKLNYNKTSLLRSPMVTINLASQSPVPKSTVITGFSGMEIIFLPLAGR